MIRSLLVFSPIILSYVCMPRNISLLPHAPRRLSQFTYGSWPIVSGRGIGRTSERVEESTEENPREKFLLCEWNISRDRLRVWTFSGWSDDAPWAPMRKSLSFFRHTALQPSPRNLSRASFYFRMGCRQKISLISSLYPISRISHWRMTLGAFVSLHSRRVSCRVALR